MEYKPKTSWLKGQIAKKRGDRVYDHNIAEERVQRMKVNYAQNNPSSVIAKQINRTVGEDVTAYIRAKNKARGTQSSAERKAVK